MNKVYTVDDAVKSLNKLPNVKVANNEIRIVIDTPVGSKSWGKISFLEKNGYYVTKVKSVGKVNKSRDDEDGDNKRRIKHNKVDLVSKVKMHLPKTR